MNLFHLLASSLALAASLAAQTVVIKPYVQPAESTSGTNDTKLLVWFTDQKLGTFSVQYGTTTNCEQTAFPLRVPLNINTNLQFYKYIAALRDLPLDAEIFYRVQLDEETVRASSFASCKSATNALRFLVVGDTADGKPASRQIAYQMAQTKSDMLLIVGDIVYPRGRVTEYFSNFWKMYNNITTAEPTLGAPFMQSVPIHAVLGNHDVMANNLTFTPDGMGAFYFFHAPTNGPRLASGIEPITGAQTRVAAFKEAVRGAHPALAFYSFDNGPAHFLCLDGNRTTNINDRALHQWIERDLQTSRAAWKFVFFHQPGFQSSLNHYSEQRMRLLEPLFEKGGVDVVFTGHVHNYQRSKPLKFKPNKAEKLDSRGYVEGKFTLDENFDGQEKTRADGVIHLVTGGGGAGLYNTNYTDTPAKWARTNAWAPFTTKFVSDRHSFSLVELDAKNFSLRQVDENGVEVDRFRITKENNKP